MTPFSRLKQIKEIAEGVELVDVSDSWHALHEKAVAMEGKLALIAAIAREYEEILGMEAT